MTNSLHCAIESTVKERIKDLQDEHTSEKQILLSRIERYQLENNKLSSKNRSSQADFDKKLLQLRSETTNRLLQVLSLTSEYLRPQRKAVSSLKQFVIAGITEMREKIASSTANISASFASVIRQLQLCHRSLEMKQLEVDTLNTELDTVKMQTKCEIDEISRAFGSLQEEKMLLLKENFSLDQRLKLEMEQGQALIKRSEWMQMNYEDTLSRLIRRCNNSESQLRHTACSLQELRHKSNNERVSFECTERELMNRIHLLEVELREKDTRQAALEQRICSMSRSQQAYQNILRRSDLLISAEECRYPVELTSHCAQRDIANARVEVKEDSGLARKWILTDMNLSSSTLEPKSTREISIRGNELDQKLAFQPLQFPLRNQIIAQFENASKRRRQERPFSSSDNRYSMAPRLPILAEVDKCRSAFDYITITESSDLVDSDPKRPGLFESEYTSNCIIGESGELFFTKLEDNIVPDRLALIITKSKSLLLSSQAILQIVGVKS